MHVCAYIIISGDEMESKKSPLEQKNFIQNNIDFDFYKTLFDPVRIEILLYLVIKGKSNIREISENFSQDRSVISRHLDLMNRYGIVKKSKENRNIYYEADSKFVIDKFELTSDNIKKMMLCATSEDYME